MHLQRSSTLPTHGTGVDWNQLEEQVSSLNDLTHAIEESQRSSVTRSQVVRWQELSTPTLVALAQAGHQDAFDPIYRRYSGRIMAYLVRKVSGNRDLAGDLAAEVWSVALTSIDKFRPSGAEDDLAAWLIVIAKNRWLRSHAHGWRESCADASTIDQPQLWGESTLVNVGQGVCDDYSDAYQELRRRLYAEIERLSAKQRTVVTMWLNGAGRQEIAHATGLAIEQVKSARNHAFRALKYRLGEKVSVDELFGNSDLVKEGVDLLPEVQRTVVRMHLDGMRLCDIARELDKSPSAVEKAWYHGQRSLRVWVTGRMSSPQESSEQVARKAAQAECERARLRGAAQSFSPTKQRVVLMHLDGMRLCDIARETGLTRGSVSRYWYNAKQAFIRQGLIAA